MNVRRETFALPRGAAPGIEIFAFGDVHGRSDLLAAAISSIAGPTVSAPSAWRSRRARRCKPTRPWGCWATTKR